MQRQHIYGAALGLTLSVGPTVGTVLFPSVSHLRLLGLYVLGGLVGLGACRARTRPLGGAADDAAPAGDCDPPSDLAPSVSPSLVGLSAALLQQPIIKRMKGTIADSRLAIGQVAD